MNSGERNELLLKINLVMLRESGESLAGGKVDSVGYNNTEYRPPPKITKAGLSLLNNRELTVLSERMGIKKAGVFEKSDVYINGVGYSVKSFSAAPPALVNHTARPGFETACKYSNAKIQDLDVLIDKYWALREANLIKEDVANEHPDSPFKDSVAVLGPVLKYFLFKGSGRGPSKFPASYILDYTNPLNEKTWKVLDADTVVDFVWDKLFFSLRATKGMPTNYPNNTNTGSNESIAKWTRLFQNKYRGALHIRVKK